MATNFSARTITFNQNFKIVKNTSSPKFGQTRESISVSFVNAADQLADLSETKLHRILNEGLIQYAKKLILENGDNWEYIPSAEQITLEELYSDLTTTKSRARILTNKNIEAWFIEFASLATTAGKSQAYISTIGILAKEKFARLAGAENSARLAKVAEFFTELEFRDEMNSQVHEKLIELITDMLETDDSLELTLDSLD